MKTLRLLAACAALALVSRLAAAEHPVLPLGTPLPEFDLPGVDGRRHTPADYKDSRLLAIVFTCNHCPTAQAYEDRLIRLAKKYDRKDVALVAVNPNSSEALRLDEEGYSDLDDTFESMKERARQKGFPFPYLDDGPTEEFSRKLGPAATPHVFIFDRDRRLRYEGRVDDAERESLVKEHTAEAAIDALLAGKDPSPATTKVFGCSTKWNDKAEDNRRWLGKVRAEAVSLAPADAAALRALRANSGTGKVRVINIWATWCGPCVAEFDDLVKVNLRYRNRDFEMVTLAAQYPDEAPKVQKFLSAHHASTKNLIFGSTDKYALMEAIDPEWNGALPHTLVIGPDGKVLFRQTGAVDILALRRAIVPALNAITPWGN
ncbi:redoxin [Opitutaceae bacterium EW11]|nr:redoxin [Opitutaceae bacterium EW11]